MFKLLARGLSEERIICVLFNQEVPRNKEKPKASTAGPGLLTPDMELFCKAGPDGKSLGDCPFTHYVQVCDSRRRREPQLTTPLWSLRLPSCGVLRFHSTVTRGVTLPVTECSGYFLIEPQQNGVVFLMITGGGVSILWRGEGGAGTDKGG